MTHDPLPLLIRPVAILCAAKKSAYKDMPGLEVYDEARDARTFTGGMPVVAHPPCRTWSRTMKHFVRLGPAEKKAEQDLAIWCCQKVQEEGGIVEQPANSGLWEAAGLPMPGSPAGPDSFSLHVWQRWWGFPQKKGTWLYFRGISQFAIEIPFLLAPRSPYGYDWYSKGSRGTDGSRAQTLPAFAEWLVSLARSAHPAMEKASHE